MGSREAGLPGAGPERQEACARALAPLLRVRAEDKLGGNRMGRLICLAKGHKPGKYVAYSKQIGHIYRCTECGALIVKKGKRWVKSPKR